MSAERSYLFVPGDRPERFGKALATSADRVILDLEDAVLPDAKPGARDAILSWLAGPDSRSVLVRVNASGTPWHADDLQALSGQPRVAGLMLPKAEDPGTLRLIRSGLRDDQMLVALVETVRAIANLRAVASVPGVQRLAFGSVDFCTEAGIRGYGRELDFVRGALVLESSLAGLLSPIEGVTVDVRDAILLGEDIERARAFGFGGKLCIHPSQVAAVNAGFSPSAAEIAWAERVVAAAEAGSPGATVVDGKLVDRPVRLQAEAILRQAVSAP